MSFLLRNLFPLTHISFNCWNMNSRKSDPFWLSEEVLKTQILVAMLTTQESWIFKTKVLVTETEYVP